MSRNITNNQRTTTNVIDSISSVPFAVKGISSDGSINVNITSGGSGGTQYTDGGTPPTHPIGTAIEFNNSGTWATVGVANPLPITGSISVGGTTDESTFTAGASTFTSSGGVYNDSVANLTAGQQGAQRLTIARAIHINLRNVTGTEVGTSGAPLQVSLANTAANASAVKVDGSAVIQPVSLTSTTITGTVAATQSGTWNIATVTAVTAITNALPAGTNVIGHVIADTGSTTAVTGTVATSEVAPTTVFNGKTTVTTAGTRVVLASSTTVKSVTIKALAANTGTIYVGNSTVASTNGLQLAAGDTVSLDVSNLNTVNIDSSVNGEGVSYLAVN